jgi:DamX protein
MERWYKGEFPKLPDAPSTAVGTNKEMPPKEVTPAKPINTASPPAVKVSATPTPNTVVSNTAKPASLPATPSTEYYAIQLMASDKESDVTHFMEKWQADLNVPQIVDRSKQAKPLFILVSGSYPSRLEAQQALDNLDPELKANRRNRLLLVKMNDKTLTSSLD